MLNKGLDFLKRNRYRNLRYIIAIPTYMISLVGVIQVFIGLPFLGETPAPTLLAVYFLAVVAINYTLFHKETGDTNHWIHKTFCPLVFKTKSPKFLYVYTLLKFSLFVFIVLIFTLLLAASKV